MAASFEVACSEWGREHQRRVSQHRQEAVECAVAPSMGMLLLQRMLQPLHPSAAQCATVSMPELRDDV